MKICFVYYKVSISFLKKYIVLLLLVLIVNIYVLIKHIFYDGNYCLMSTIGVYLGISLAILLDYLLYKVYQKNLNYNKYTKEEQNKYTDKNICFKVDEQTNIVESFVIIENKISSTLSNFELDWLNIDNIIYKKSILTILENITIYSKDQKYQVYALYTGKKDFLNIVKRYIFSESK